ncbi:flagellar basal body L-ring protein [Dinoroseobacter shibae DFL 12 = DSM 16493]|jgi:flagellar L-ring protein precursor FlgH|uniref:Flagellar L-ring protein n=1 Tax=Dinoroseobacter shibae (strain DSM 16493 / NCIMB 14021 / DFL 12) TaxID=398580 RepID=A8LMR2_DINSH|nr:flagellar basal body L-ring protein FlgH [Dinoroseobacter shibae]ABV94987.1 flagellar basal body L-ring protein [Dinoroseobacter shibae DFL 12 = DSM 16493]URF46406.1 flagellar basal body L-ring protein FlgH [Dinoroseobacter shibae]URF50712.1 flagellar basal body L-ring protein FlgH [Dinoroseobacter shibae]
MRIFVPFVACLVVLSACGRIADVGQAPDFTASSSGSEYQAMISAPIASDRTIDRAPERASLWSGTRNSLLGDRRAGQNGDILTVVIEIDDRAEISNSSERSRSGSETLAIDDFFGLPQRIDPRLPEGASLGSAVGVSSNGSSSGDGSVSRREKLTLRVAATVVGVMPNGVFEIQGTQEVRVNFELRELIVTGFVRPEDISRQNEITYDKIASARISYAGRGQITDVQQPRYGQQIADIILPF